jgi:hypothetical protein
MSALRHALWRFLLGALLGLVAAFSASPRLGSARHLSDVFVDATKKADVAMVRGLIPPLLRRLQNSPSQLAELGHRYLLPLDQPDLLEEYARGLLRVTPADDPAAAEAHMILARAALLRQNETAARREYEIVTQRYWDFQQAIDAEQKLRWMDAGHVLRDIADAAAQNNWSRVMALFDRSPYTSFGHEDQVQAAGLYFEALMATGRADEATKLLAALADPAAGINIPEVIVPWRVVKYHDAAEILRRALAALPAGRRWRAETACVLALLDHDWRTMVSLLPTVDRTVACNCVVMALQQNIGEKESREGFRILSTRAGLSADDLALLYLAAAQAELRRKDENRAGELAREGIGRIEKNAAAGLYLLQVQMMEHADAAGALARLTQLLGEFQGNGRFTSMAVQEGYDLLRRLHRAEDACAFVRRYGAGVDRPELVKQLLQGCTSSR